MRHSVPAITALTSMTLAGPAFGHEAWLLTPSEIIELAKQPIPPLFGDRTVLGLVGFATGVAGAVAAWAGDRFGPLEERLFRAAAARAAELGPLAVRLGLATMLGLGSLGGLPRSGTAIWAQPTLFVPDMQLSLAAPVWGWLGALQLALAVLLALGLQTRPAAIGVAFLCGLGWAAFGGGFLAYAPHFLAPALLLLVYGGGAYACDNVLEAPRQPQTKALARQAIWRVALLLFGATFVYHGVAYKLMQPTLIMAILKHGEVPTLGVPLDVVALIMAVIEISIGALLALGRLVRPIALFLIGSFTFFVAALGETPLFHANLYGAMAMLLMAGSWAPSPAAARAGFRLTASKQKG